MLYGLSVIVLYALLSAAGIPSFYDKLLPRADPEPVGEVIDRAARLLVAAHRPGGDWPDMVAAAQGT